MTINARNLELMLRRLAALPLVEAKQYSEKLYEATKDIAPSLIRYIQATDYDKFTKQNLLRQILLYYKNIFLKQMALKYISASQLTSFSPDADTRVAAALVFSASNA